MRKIMISVLVLFASASLVLESMLPATAGSSGPGQRAAPAARSVCGSWRWPVKTGADKDRHKVKTHVVHTSIHYLRSRRAPSSFPYYYRDHRFRGPERHIYQLTRVRLTAFRLEDDGDIHLVLKNNSGKSMIAEIPKPGCVSTRSLWRKAIRAVRASFTRHYRVTTSWHDVNRRITIRGLGFFDEVHGQDGVAPNGIELHPVTRIRFPS